MLQNFVKHGTEDEGHTGVTDDLENRDTYITSDSLHVSDQKVLDLHSVTDGVRGGRSGTLGLFCAMGLLQLQSVGIRVPAQVGVDNVHEPAVVFRLLPMGLHFLCSSRDLATGLDVFWVLDSLGWVGDGGEEVCGGLSLGAHVTHVQEVLLGLFGRAVENLVALVQNAHFVEEVVGVLGALVDGDHTA